MSANEPSATEPIENALDPAGFAMRHHEPDQASLFPSEDLVIPETLRSMRKAVAAIHATPTKGDAPLTLNTRRLFDACILVAQLDFRMRGRAAVERVKTERVTPMFETRVSELAKLAGIPGKNYTRIYQVLDELFDMTLKWNIIAEDADVQWEMKSHFLSSVGYGKGLKQGLIRFSIDPSILEIVLEPSNWATLSLQAMEGLGTAASYALYQNAWRYIGTHQKVTANLPVAVWIELLMGKSGYVIDEPDGTKKVARYGDFKRRVLMDAIDRVNQVHALSYTLELKETKSGNRVSRLQFKFVPKKQEALAMPLAWPQEILSILRNLGFTEVEIQDLSQARSYEEVAESILRLKASEQRFKAQGRTISSAKAYFNGILSNVALGAGESELSDEKIEAEAKQQEALQAAQIRQQRAAEAFSRHQTERFAVEFFAQDPEARASTIAEFENSEDGRKAQLLSKKGWNPKNVGALVLLRRWLAATHPELIESLLPNPEDKSLEAWMAWRLDLPSSA